MQRANQYHAIQHQHWMQEKNRAKCFEVSKSENFASRFLYPNYQTFEHNKNILWHTKPQKFCDTKINIEYNLEESTQGEKQTQEMPQERRNKVFKYLGEVYL